MYDALGGDFVDVCGAIIAAAVFGISNSWSCSENRFTFIFITSVSLVSLKWLEIVAPKT